MTVLLAAICFEGLGRTILLQVPSLVFYLAKDVVLLAAFVFIGVKPDVVALVKSLYGKFSVFLGLSVIWTVLQVFNPEQPSFLLGALGLRSYWVWWLAPVLIASALRGSDQRNRAAVVLGAFAIFIALYATLQFAAPPEAEINSYALYDGEAIMKTAYVFATGRTRVSGTFSYLSGFADFAVAAPVMLLSVGLDAKLHTRVITIAGAVLLASTVAMAGSRNGIILCSVGLVVLLFRSGFIRSRTGWWTLVAIALAAAFSFYRAEEAVEGMVGRFEGDDTSDRIERELRILPPLALARSPYPLFGLGTGMQQNARFQFGVPTMYGLEEEPPRLLVELGAIGFLLFWTARLGILIGLVRASRILKRAGKMGASGGATALAVLTMFNRIVFDHVWQSLFFTALGITLSATLDATQQLKKTAAKAA
ncbi:MAG: O-antigen ligase family protein [Polyangia bacterium]